MGQIGGVGERRVVVEWFVEEISEAGINSMGSRAYEGRTIDQGHVDIYLSNFEFCGLSEY